jgi:hypothetical protein
MSAHELSTLLSGRARFALEAGFIVLAGAIAAVLDLGPLAIVIVMGLAWAVVALVGQLARSTRLRRAPRAARAEPAVETSAPKAEGRRPRFFEPRGAAEPQPSASGEWNLWELERRAREHAGADAVPEEWAAIFMSLREFAKSDGAIPPQFDALVRESFPELTRAG